MAEEKVNYIGLFTKLIPGVISLMAIAQRLFSGKPKSGAEKKELVLATVETVLSSTLAVSTGGQKETWEAIKEPVGMLIDAAAAMKISEPEMPTDAP